MQLLKHQIEATEKIIRCLKTKQLCYLFGPPRVGKSLTALHSCSHICRKRILVLTKKAAIEGWQQYKNIYDFDVINYEQITKLSASHYDVVIIDEAHNFGALPKPSLRNKQVRAFCKDKTLLLLSGTPLIEKPLAIYPQFALSSFSPFKHKSFYMFFREFGVPSPVYFSGRSVETYTKFKQNLLEIIENYVVRVSYEDAGFNYQNEDLIMWLEPSEDYLDLRKALINDRIIENVLFDTPSKLMHGLHQIDGGTLDNKILIPKLQNTSRRILELCEKAKKQNKKVAVMSYFVAEQEMLRNILPSNCKVFSSTKYCEGVDLSDFDIYVLYSFGYSGAKFVQLRDRIVNLKKQKKTQCVIPLIKGSTSELIYNKVSLKRNFNSAMLMKMLT